MYIYIYIHTHIYLHTGSMGRRDCSCCMGWAHRLAARKVGLGSSIGPWLCQVQGHLDYVHLHDNCCEPALSVYTTQEGPVHIYDWNSAPKTIIGMVSGT